MVVMVVISGRGVDKDNNCGSASVITRRHHKDILDGDENPST